MTKTTKPRRMAREPATNGTLPHRAASKQSQVLDLLRGEGGAPLAAITALTGWQAHTARAALTGLRKKGHAIERQLADGESRYCLTGTVPE
ncbi:MAG: DUF3489 domain-containing protein [Pseudomonadota bacterium]